MNTIIIGLKSGRAMAPLALLLPPALEYQKKRNNGIKKKRLAGFLTESPRIQCFERHFDNTSTLIIIIPTILVSGSTVSHKYTIICNNK